MRIVVIIVLLAGGALAGGVPEPIREAEWVDAGTFAAVEAGEFEKLARAGIRAAPALLHHRQTQPAERQARVASLLRRAYRFEIGSFVLKGVTLAEACRRLAEASGVTVRAEGEAARPITVKLEDATFWEAVLAICEAGGVGLAPHHVRFDRTKWLAGHRGNPVTIGPAHPRPKHVFTDGPVLVQLAAKEIAGERAGTLEVRVRYVPELPVRAMTVPHFRDGRDWEN